MKGKKTSAAKVHNAANGASVQLSAKPSSSEVDQQSIVDQNLSSTFGLSSSFAECFVSEPANGDTNTNEYELDTSDEEVRVQASCDMFTQHLLNFSITRT
jgi:hypothetical protein